MKNNEEITISQASQADFSFWKEMRKALWNRHSEEFLEKEFEQILQRPTYTALIAYQAQNPVGFLEYQKREDAYGTTDPVLYVEGLYVKAEFRKQGISTKLLEHLRKIAKEQGINHIASDALLENSVSIAAHKAMGFKEKERLVHFLMDSDG